MKQQVRNRTARCSFRSLFVMVSALWLLSSMLVAMPTTQNAPMHPADVDHAMSSADPAQLNLTYYTPANPTGIPVLPASAIAGDHVILRAAWSVSVVNRSRLEVVAPAIPATLVVEQNTPTLEIDTKGLGNNATCLINSTAWLTNGSVLSIVYQNVYIGNYFVPKVTVLAPNGGEEWTNVNTIRWVASDVNVGDTLRYDVRISDDSGVTFVTIASAITQKSFDWNCSQYDKLDTYLVEICATDGIYFSYDRSDSLFTAGEIPINSTSTTTNTTTPLIDYRIAAFVAILLISSVTMALVVYYVARKWF